MAEEDVAKIAAASTAAADKIHNLLSASDVDTLKHQQLLMYCSGIFLFLLFCGSLLWRNFVHGWEIWRVFSLLLRIDWEPSGFEFEKEVLSCKFLLILIEFHGDWVPADSEGCRTATQCYLISMIFRSVALLQWRTTSPKIHGFSSPWRLTLIMFFGKLGKLTPKP